MKILIQWTAKNLGLISITISAFCFALLTTIAILLFKGGATPITVLIGRFSIATLLFFFTILIRDRKLFRVARKDIKWFLFTGFILFANIMSFWYALESIKIVSILIGIFFTYPIWTAILTPLVLKERINKIVPLCIAIGLVGVLLVLGVIPNGILLVPLIGVLLALSSAITWAIYYIGSQSLQRKKYNFFTIIFYNFFFVLIACLFLQPISLTLSQISLDVFWYILTIGVISTYISYLFLQLSLKLSGSIVTGIHNMIQPVLAIIIAFFVLKQGMTPFQMLGITVILLNIYLLNKVKKDGRISNKP